jgi:hypothetical protein
MVAFHLVQGGLWVGSVGWPVLKADGDQERIVIQLLAASSGYLHNCLKANNSVERNVGHVNELSLKNARQLG